MSNMIAFGSMEESVKIALAGDYFYAKDSAEVQCFASINKLIGKASMIRTTREPLIPEERFKMYGLLPDTESCDNIYDLREPT